MWTGVRWVFEEFGVSLDEDSLGPLSEGHGAPQDLGAPAARRAERAGDGGLILDQAGWHGSKKLQVPPDITLLHLLPRAPELNPVENVWQFLRDNWLSNTIFGSYDQIVELS